MPSQLYPDQADLRQSVHTWEDRFNDGVGPSVRRWAYAHLIGQTPLMTKLATADVAWTERLAFRLGLPLLRPMIARRVDVSAAAVARSLAELAEVLVDVERTLADSRPYLVGEQFTAADLTLASLLAPAVLPPEYGGVLPTLEDLPPAMRAEIQAFRARPAGEFALRLYAEER